MLPDPDLGAGIEGEQLRKLTNLITDFNSEVWATKNASGIGRGKPIEGIKVPSELIEFESHLIAMHKLE